MNSHLGSSRRYWLAGSVFSCALVMACAPTPQQQAPTTAPSVPPPASTASIAAASPKAPTGGETMLAAPRPKLIVVIAIDQFRADFLTRFEPHFSADGFRRLKKEGASFTGHYGHYVTYTGPGHALMLSGSYPYVNGIFANKFFNQDTQRSEAMVFDGSAQIIGVKTTDPGEDVSPRNFMGTTVGDELALATGRQSKTIALATKGRGAILMGGRLAKTYFINDENGEMTSSTYYGATLPAWVTAFNAKKMADSYFGYEWDRLLPEAAYAVSGLDGAEFEGGAKGLGKSFPHMVNGKLKAPGAAYYEAFTMTPFANDYEFAFAKAAVEGENLGGRGVPDMLAISLSATDLAGHDYGPFSHEVQDLALRTDRQIGAFLTWVYAKLGRENVTVVVTADHGATPIPEQMAALGFDAGRIKKKTIQDTIEAALKKKYGGDKWVSALEDPHVYLNRKLMAEKKVDPREAERVAGEAAASIKGFGGYYTRTQLLSGEVPATELGHSILRSYYAPKGGDVVLWTLPFYFWGKYGEKDAGSTHGTYYRYDSDVPVFVSGASVKPGSYGTREMVDLAATLSHLLGIGSPAGCEGQVIPLIMTH